MEFIEYVLCAKFVNFQSAILKKENVRLQLALNDARETLKAAYEKLSAKVIFDLCYSPNL